jgi:hypothetical protein
MGRESRLAATRNPKINPPDNGIPNATRFGMPFLIPNDARADPAQAEPRQNERQRARVETSAPGKNYVAGTGQIFPAAVRRVRGKTRNL